MKDTWTHVKTPPECGGTYVIGGYVTRGPLRTFERTFAFYRKTLDGPEWRHVIGEFSHIPIEYWFQMPPHPEHGQQPELWPLDAPQ